MSMLGVTEPRSSALDWTRLVRSRWVWCIGAILFLMFRELATGFSDLLTSLGDTDDATRLYQVRALMAGTSWFDMSLPRLGGPHPLLSHWSRVIDLPLALLLSGFGLILSPATAELVTRIVWPLLLLCLLLRIVVRAADTQSGTTAAWLIIFFALTCVAGLFQFRIGRIDHHNGMILGSIGGLLVLLQARLQPSEGYWAGGLIGFGLAVGYEPLAFLLPALGGVALLAVVDTRWLSGVRNMALALAATLAAAFFATTAPSLWLVAKCDALSLNMVLLAGSGALGLAVIDRNGRAWTLPARIAALAAAGAAGLALFGTLDTRCLAGPFGQIDPAIAPIWLDHVVEGYTIFAFFPTSPAPIVAFAVTQLLAIAAAFTRWRRLRTPETLALLALVVIVTPPAIWMIKLTPYASWVAAFCLALTVAGFKGTATMTQLTAQLLGALGASQWTYAMIAAPLLAFGGVSNAAVKSDIIVDGTQCMTTPAIRSLAPLPRGLFVGPIDFGSYIVALTHHEALAAPYHRMDKAILANHAILNGEPNAARQLLDEVDADYVVVCMPKAAAKAPAFAGAPIASSGLEARLKAGEIIDFLAPVAVSSPVAELKVWRVVR